MFDLYNLKLSFENIRTLFEGMLVCSMKYTAKCAYRWKRRACWAPWTYLRINLRFILIYLFLRSVGIINKPLFLENLICEKDWSFTINEIFILLNVGSKQNYLIFFFLIHYFLYFWFCYILFNEHVIYYRYFFLHIFFFISRLLSGYVITWAVWSEVKHQENLICLQI